MRVVCAYGVTDRHGADGARRGLEENRRFLQPAAPAWSGACRLHLLRRHPGRGGRPRVRVRGGVHVHVAEDAVDRAAADRLRRFAGDDWVLAHGVHLAEDSGVRGTVVHNPRSNLNNAVGYARPARFTNPVALGTDGIGGDMLEEFRLAYALDRSADVTALQSAPGRGWRRAAPWFPPPPPTGSPGRIPGWSRGTSPTPPGSARLRSSSTVGWCGATADRPGSIPPRCGPRRGAGGPPVRPAVRGGSMPAALTPWPLRVLLGRVAHEWETRHRIFDLPLGKFHHNDPTADLSAMLGGRRVATPIGPAAGPHTQLAQNIVLGWLAGARVFELKTVQVLDELEIPRPCIDVEGGLQRRVEPGTPHRRVARGVRQGVDGARHSRGVGTASPRDRDAGTAPVRHVGGLRPRRDPVEGDGRVRFRPARRRQGDRPPPSRDPEPFAAWRDFAFPTRVVGGVTLSTFHGCPPTRSRRSPATS